MNTIAKEEFAKEFPCIYEGEIYCEQCPKFDACDMRSGRELHLKAYISGWQRGTDIMLAQRVETCETSSYSSRICKLGTKGCVLKHGE